MPTSARPSRTCRSAWTRPASARIARPVVVFTLLVCAAVGGAAAQDSAWSISIYTGSSPFALAPPADLHNPVLTAASVTDRNAQFVADPFLVEDGGQWTLFFEVLNNANGRGEIGYATSPDGRHWTYRQIVLRESFHLSYPYVFKWNGEYYMVPEAGASNSIRLYKATNFPTGWTFVQTLVSGRTYHDSSLAYFRGKWWMFTSPVNDTLRLFYADSLTGPWTEHPRSPLVTGDANVSRLGGRALVWQGKLYRYAQDDSPTYGNQVRAYEVTDITTSTYAETQVSPAAIVQNHGKAWAKDGMHTVDPVETAPGTWLAAVDGIGDPTFIDKADWSLVSVDCADPGHPGSSGFDGSRATFWQSASAGTYPPHEIRIDLGHTYELSGVRWLPRQDGQTTGLVRDYEIYVSTDGEHWGAPVAAGAFDNAATAKDVRFEPAVGRYVRMLALNSQGGDRLSAVGELDAWAFLYFGNHSPQSSIAAPAVPLTVVAGQPALFEGRGIDPDGDAPLTYAWDFGAGSGVTPSAEASPGVLTFPVPGTFEATFRATDPSMFTDPLPARQTVTVVDPGGAPLIPQAGWKLLSVDCEERSGENGAGVNAFDGSAKTNWHTQYTPTKVPPPHEIQVDLGAVYNVEGLRVLPRQDGSTNGRIGRFELYVTEDRAAWGAPVATGTFANDGTERQARFARAIGRYVRLRELTVASGDDYAVVAELNLLGTPFDGNRPPETTIVSPTADMTLVAGQSVTFAASGVDPDGNLALAWRWRFGAGAGVPDSTLQAPGAVTFGVPGTFLVTATAIDATGLADPTPATRRVVVLDGGTPPDGTIDAPAEDTSVMAGAAVTFAGTGRDTGNAGPLSFRWHFGDGSGVPDSALEDPGPVVFPLAGTYTVTFTVTDRLGLTDGSPAQRVIRVVPQPARPAPRPLQWNSGGPPSP